MNHSEKTTAAKKLLADLNRQNKEEKEIFFTEDSDHFYSHKANAKAQAKDKKVYRLGLSDNDATEISDSTEDIQAASAAPSGKGKGKKVEASTAPSADDKNASTPVVDSASTDKK